MKRLAKVVVDLSGRPYLLYNVKIRPGRVGDFDTDLPHEFFAAFANQLGMNLHIDVPRGENPHHIIEACFKAFARAMDFATQVDPRVQGVLSTKGVSEIDVQVVQKFKTFKSFGYDCDYRLRDGQSAQRAERARARRL